MYYTCEWSHWLNHCWKTKPYYTLLLDFKLKHNTLQHDAADETTWKQILDPRTFRTDSTEHFLHCSIKCQWLLCSSHDNDVNGCWALSQQYLSSFIEAAIRIGVHQPVNNFAEAQKQLTGQYKQFHTDWLTNQLPWLANQHSSNYQSTKAASKSIAWLSQQLGIKNSSFPQLLHKSHCLLNGYEWAGCHLDIS